MWIDTQASSESRTFVVLWLFYMGYLFWMSSGQSSCSPWFWDHMWFIPKFSHVHTCISQPGWILARRLAVRWHHLLWVAPSPFLIPKESFCAYVIETTSLTLRIETYVISFSLLWAGPSSSLPLPLPWSESVHWRQCSGVYPVPFVIYIWKCKQEAGCKCLT